MGSNLSTMLNINVKFIAGELVPGLVSGEYSVADGVSVRDLLGICEKQCGVTVPEKNLKFIYPLFNGRPVTLDAALSESGTLHVCRTVIGG